MKRLLLLFCSLSVVSCSDLKNDERLSGLWQSDANMTLQRNKTLTAYERMVVNKEFGKLFYYFDGGQLQIVYQPKGSASDLLDYLENSEKVLLEEGGFVDSYDYTIEYKTESQYKLQLNVGFLDSKTKTFFFVGNAECFFEKKSNGEKGIEEYFCKVGK